jgi:hypothetical protein
MVTSLNNKAPVQDIGYKVEQIIRTRVTAANVGGAPVVIGGIPPNALITGGQVVVNTAFDGTTPVINVGYSDPTGSNAAAYASAMAIAATGSTILDDMLLAPALPLSRATNVTATIPAAAGNTVGSADVLIKFVA